MSDPEERRRKTLVGVYEPDADWILGQRKEKPRHAKGKRKRQNTADVVEEVVKHYKETAPP